MFLHSVVPFGLTGDVDLITCIWMVADFCFSAESNDTLFKFNETASRDIK